MKIVCNAIYKAHHLISGILVCCLNAHAKRMRCIWVCKREFRRAGPGEASGRGVRGIVAATLQEEAVIVVECQGHLCRWLFFTLSRHLPCLTETKNKLFCKIHWSHDLSNYLQFAPPNTHFKISAIKDYNANLANIRKKIISTNRKPLGHPSGLAGYRLYAFVVVMKFKSPYLNLTFVFNVFMYSWHHVGFGYSVMVNIGLHLWTRTL